MKLKGLKFVFKSYFPYQHIKDAWVCTDLDRLKQVLLNLLSNALKFTSWGKISVSVYVDWGSISFKVKDTGVGISEKDQKKLFTVFGMGNDNQQLNSKGNGLGLTIVKGIVEWLEGEIRYESFPGKGTAFFFTIKPQSMVFLDDEVYPFSGMIPELKPEEIKQEPERHYNLAVAPAYV